MKEFSLTLKEGLASGLRRESRNARNTQALYTCNNLRPTESGLVAVNAITSLVTSSESYPFPQLFRGQSKTLLVGATSVAELDGSWNETALATYDALNKPSTKAITSGGSWHFFDFFDTWFLLNGSCVVFTTNIEGMLEQTVKTLVQDTQTVTTGCSHGGRAFFGGFNPSNYWSADWTAFWTDFATRNPTGVKVDLNIDTNFVCWSSIGGGDVLWPLYLERAITGFLGSGTDYGYDRALLFEQMKSNQAGFMPMPFQGTVRALKSLRKSIVVYTDNGIAAMVPTAVDDVPVLSLQKFIPIGIASRSAVGGDEDRHIFVDRTMTLWSIDAGLKVERLGYQEYLATLVAANLLVSFDPLEREFYITDGTGCFVLTKLGLCKATQIPTSIIRVDEDLDGYVTSATQSSQTAGSFTTDVLDFGFRGRKRIGFVEVGSSGISSMTVSAYWRNSTTGAFTQTSWKAVNADGFVYLGISAVDVRIAVRGTLAVGATVDYLTIRYQRDEKRQVRGI